MREFKKITDEWLETTAKKLADQGIEINDREEVAVRSWISENVADFTLQEGDDEEEMMRITEWKLLKIRSHFLTQRNKDFGYVDPLFTGVFYYAGEFCEVDIPVVMGSPRINPLHHLKMEELPKKYLVTDRSDLMDYVSIFADSYDYAYSIEELDGKCSNTIARQFFSSGDWHLRSVKALLYQVKVSVNAVELARMAIEMFLKAYVAQIDGLDEEGLRRTYGHNLERLANRCESVGAVELKKLRGKIALLPDVSSRYKIENRILGELWGAYVLTLRSALAVLRPLSQRDCRKNFGL